MNKEFHGWAQIKVADLLEIKVQKTDAVGENNPFHAEIVRGNHSDIGLLRSLAFRLCYCAEKQPFLEKP